MVAMDGLITLDLNNVPLLSNELQSIFRSCLNLEWLKVSGCKGIETYVFVRVNETVLCYNMPSSDSLIFLWSTFVVMVLNWSGSWTAHGGRGLVLRAGGYGGGGGFGWWWEIVEKDVCEREMCIEKGRHFVLPYPKRCREWVNEKPSRYLHARLEEVRMGAFFGSWRNIGFAVHLLKCICRRSQANGHPDPLQGIRWRG
ncbi:hypothetical protein Acr_00g0019220 [Actinidia rufa]|uniref:RNI-like superfamily protein n=1 Tax=Actinidia rufa TaxID=165716 RepID=A0A7J0DD32_9ERIC|nr:hypothetical protein Acr_00g0019220 [Actinidia rufa]